MPLRNRLKVASGIAIGIPMGIAGNVEDGAPPIGIGHWNSLRNRHRSSTRNCWLLQGPGNSRRDRLGVAIGIALGIALAIAGNSEARAQTSEFIDTW